MQAGDIVYINLPPMQSYDQEVKKYGVVISTEMRIIAQAYEDRVVYITEVLDVPGLPCKQLIRLEGVKRSKSNWIWYWPATILRK